MLLNKITLSTKMIAIPLCVAIIMASIFVFLLPHIHSRLFEEKRIKTRQLVEVAAALINHYVDLEKKGLMKPAEAKAAAKAAIKALRYDGKEYFWINNFEPRMVMHPYKSSLDGKLVGKFKDVNGVYLFNEMIKVAKTKGQGFVSYHWHKPGHDDVFLKISYVKAIPAWGWIVGSGIYVDDVTEEVNHIIYAVALVVAVIFVLVVIVSWLFARSVSRPLTRAINVLDAGSVDILHSARNMSSSSQQLAESNSQQAASLEKTAASLEELASMTHNNADNARQADSLMTDTQKVVTNAENSMQQMNQSMTAISDASDEVGKIIKTIDEIAFQTNLLALNAAVEAARAGEHGAGFAVVADEVRSLAMRAAEAAKSTQALIKNTLQQVSKGSEIVRRTNTDFAAVAESSGKVGQLVSDIATSSSEQSQGIDQINRAVSEMDTMVQSNAANAEETATEAEQMRSQAELIKEVVAELVAISGVSRKTRGLTKKTPSFEQPSEHPTAEALPGPSKHQPAARPQVSPQEDIDGFNGNFDDF